jgi:hypothetical protein
LPVPSLKDRPSYRLKPAKGKSVRRLLGSKQKSPLVLPRPPLAQR